MKFFVRLRLFFIGIYVYFFRFLKLVALNPFLAVLFFRLFPIFAFFSLSYIFVMAGDVGDALLYHISKLRAHLLPFFSYFYEPIAPTRPTHFDNFLASSQFRAYSHLQTKLIPEFMRKQLYWYDEEMDDYIDYLNRIILAHPVMIAADEITAPSFNHFSVKWFPYTQWNTSRIDPISGLSWDLFPKSTPLFKFDKSVTGLSYRDLNRLCRLDVLSDFNYLSYSSRSLQSGFFGYDPFSKIAKCHPIPFELDDEELHRSFVRSPDFSLNKGFYFDDFADFDSEGFLPPKKKPSGFRNTLGDLNIDNELIMRLNTYSQDLHTNPPVKLLDRVYRFFMPSPGDVFYSDPDELGYKNPIVLVDWDFRILREPPSLEKKIN